MPVFEDYLTVYVKHLKTGVENNIDVIVYAEVTGFYLYREINRIHCY